jgi:hypothetical protein
MQEKCNVILESDYDRLNRVRKCEKLRYERNKNMERIDLETKM